MRKIPTKYLPKGNALNEVSFDERWLSQKDYKRNQEIEENKFRLMKNRKTGDGTRKKIIELHKQGMSQVDISYKVNRTQQWVSYVLKGVV